MNIIVMNVYTHILAHELDVVRTVPGDNILVQFRRRLMYLIERHAIVKKDRKYSYLFKEPIRLDIDVVLEIERTFRILI